MSPRERGQPLPRRRVTAPGTGRAAGPRAVVDPGAENDEIRAIYLGALVRAQLRLGILCAVSFLAAIASAAVAIAAIPLLQATLVFGVPWAWVLQAYGMYPLVIVFAAVYVAAARRNERRFSQLDRTG